jgi:hypothetical protein
MQEKEGRALGGTSFPIVATKTKRNRGGNSKKTKIKQTQNLIADDSPGISQSRKVCLRSLTRKEFRHTHTQSKKRL